MVALGQKVKVHYVGKFDDGTMFDSSIERGEPLEFVVGNGAMLPSFELAVSNMNPGEQVDINIPAEQAYGLRDENLIVKVPISSVPDSDKIVVGEYMSVKYPEGVANVKVVSKDDGLLVIDCNHELAGQNLHFNIKLLELVRESLIEEEKHASGCGCGCDRLKEALDPEYHGHHHDEECDCC